MKPGERGPAEQPRAQRNGEHRAGRAPNPITIHGRTGRRRARASVASAPKPVDGADRDVERVRSHDEPLARDGRDDAVAYGHVAPLLEQDRGRGVGCDETRGQRHVERLAREPHRKHLRQRGPVPECPQQSDHPPRVERHSDREGDERHEHEGARRGDGVPRGPHVRVHHDASEDEEGDEEGEDLEGAPSRHGCIAERSGGGRKSSSSGAPADGVTSGGRASNVRTVGAMSARRCGRSA